MSLWYFKRLHNYSDCCTRTGWQDYENWNVFQKLFGFFFLFFFFLFALVVWECTAAWMVTLGRKVNEEWDKQVIPGPLFLPLLKVKWKGIQPHDFHNHNGPHLWCPAHCRACFGTRQLLSLSCGAMEERQALPKSTVHLRQLLPVVPWLERAANFTRLGKVCPFWGNAYQCFLRRHFLECNDACPTPEDCSLCLEGRKDLVLPDLHKLGGTCLTEWWPPN